jgi:hypothetical protein
MTIFLKKNRKLKNLFAIKKYIRFSRRQLLLLMKKQKRKKNHKIFVFFF